MEQVTEIYARGDVKAVSLKVDNNSAPDKGSQEYLQTIKLAHSRNWGDH
jgi:hypothetical protein